MKPASGYAVVHRRLQPPRPKILSRKPTRDAQRLRKKVLITIPTQTWLTPGCTSPPGPLQPPRGEGCGGRREGEASPVPAGRRPASAATMQRPGGRRSSSPSSLPLSSAQPSPSPPHPATAAPGPAAAGTRRRWDTIFRIGAARPCSPPGHPRTARHGDGPRPLSHTHPPTLQHALHIHLRCFTQHARDE